MNLIERHRSRLQHGLILILMGLFVFVGYRTYSNGTDSGDDLSSSYVGCRLVSGGQAVQHLFRHDPEDFTAIGPDAAWQDMADQGDFTGMLHPYVQTPLWAYLLGPICKRTSFITFKKIFAVLMLGSLALTIWLTARFWTPFLFHPFAIAVILLLVWYSQPFQYAMFLMQTHALFFCISIGGLILAERRRPYLAGFLLAFAAVVKVTPSLILVYWLLTRRRRAAMAMAIWVAALSLATVMTTGLPLFRQYLGEIGRLGHILLISQNNQSFAAWWMARFYPADEIRNVSVLALPAGVRILSTVAMVGFTVAGAWLDRRRSDRAPTGAVIALVAAMLFAPIAWTHYSILLIAPLMLLAQQDRKHPSWRLTGLILVILALNYPPLATNVVDWEIGRYAIVRGQFFAGILCLFGLAYMALQSETGRRHDSLQPSASRVP